MAVWVIYLVRDRQYLVLADYPSLFVLAGLFPMTVAVFLGSKAVREESLPPHTRLLFGIRAMFSLLLGLASLSRGAFGFSHGEFLLVVMAVALWPVGFIVTLFAGVRSWQEKRNRPA